MFTFNYKDEEGNSSIEYKIDTQFWPEVLEHFNYFLLGCGFIPEDIHDEYPFCEPKDIKSYVNRSIFDNIKLHDDGSY